MVRMRTIALVLGVLAIAASPAQAAYQLPLSVKKGCKKGREFVRKWNRENPELIDIEFRTCYARSRYTVVVEFTAFWDDGTQCWDRGLVTWWSDGYYRWKQYALDCY